MGVPEIERAGPPGSNVLPPMTKPEACGRLTWLVGVTLGQGSPTELSPWLGSYF